MTHANNRRRALLIAVLIASCMLALGLGPLARRALAAPATLTFTVTSNLDEIDDNVGNGQCHSASGGCTLRAAIMEANRATGAGATINVPAGIYSFTISPAGGDGPDSGDLNLTTTAGSPIISIQGAGPGRTIIEANQLDRVVSVESGRTARLSGLTLRGGFFVNQDGAGLYNAGRVTLDRVSLSGNQAGDGQGGGIENIGVMTVTESTIGPGNTGNFCGGLCNDGDLLLERSTIFGNSANYGGGLTNGDSGSLVIINSTFSHNTAVSNGGGLLNSGTANVYNSSFILNGADSGNTNAGHGGGVYSGDTGTLNLRNTLLAGNLGHNNADDDCQGTLHLYGNNLFTTASPCTLIQVTTGASGALNSLALLGPLADNGGPTLTHNLLLGSNAIDGGDPLHGCPDNNSQLIATDQRGLPRVLGARCDVGALESLPFVVFLPFVRR